MLEKIKAWLAPVGALLAAVLYLLYKGKSRELENAKNDFVQQKAAEQTTEAKNAADIATEGSANALEEYNRLKSTRPDIFPDSKG